MALLRIQLLGAVRVFHADHTYDARLTQTLQPLLAWLVLNRKKTHAREALTELFWGEQREDRAAMSQYGPLAAETGARPDGVQPGAYLISTAATVGFNNDSDHWLDVAAFEARLDHLGKYLGTDVSGAHRFISSRKTANGPTLADAGGRSTLNGTGTFARGFRAARRL